MTTQPPVDPLALWRRRQRITWILAAPVVAIVGWWALADASIPVAKDLAAEPAPASVAADPRDARPPFDAEVFARRLTPAPPPPPPPPSPADAKPAFPFELVGIVTTAGADGDDTGEPGFAAALYDGVGRRLHVVRAGDRIGDVTVERVLEREVTLSRGGDTRRLAIVRKVPDPRVAPVPKGGGSTR